MQYPSTIESRERLRRSGWRIGDSGAALRGHRVAFRVLGWNGENLIRTEAATAREAWWRAVELAAAYGMLRGRTSRSFQGTARQDTA